MAEFRFDGKVLKNRNGQTVGDTDGKRIRDGRYETVGDIDGMKIRDRNLHVVADFDGKTIRDARLARLGTIDDVKRVIDGPGGISLVALWVLLVR